MRSGNDRGNRAVCLLPRSATTEEGSHAHVDPQDPMDCRNHYRVRGWKPAQLRLDGRWGDEVLRVASVHGEREHLTRRRCPDHSRTETVFNLSAFVMTLTDDSAMALAAITGDSRIPKNGYSTPAAMGMPATL